MLGNFNFDLVMASTISVGGRKDNLGVDPSKDFHGTDFTLLLESLSCGQSFTDLDLPARAHLLGIMQGMELARTGKLAQWDLSAPFFEM